MKTIATPRDELICGAIDRAEDIARSLESVDLMYELQRIRHDAERMEAKLVSRKSDAARAQPERVALSDADIKQIVIRIASVIYDDGGEIYDEDDARFYGMFARAILAAQSSTQPVIAEAARDDVDLLEALEIGLECAKEVAAETHAKYAGYKPYQHAEVDADVDKIEKTIAAVKRDDAVGDARDGERYRFAIALEDNAEMLYAAVLNNAPDHAAIGSEFDAAIAASTKDDVAMNARPADHILAGLMSQRMILCPTCGNKRCPHANDPDNYACTDSNEPGQLGSAYPVMDDGKAPQ